MPADRAALAASLLACAAALSAPLSAEEAAAPVSVIPWLSDSLTAPRIAPPSEPAATPLRGSAITVSPLGQTRRDAVGLLAASVTGLPRDTFAGSDPARLSQLIAALPADALPAMQDLALMLLLAEVDGPRAAAETDVLFLARVDGLLRLGALDQAQALLERAGATDQPAFRRWWDVSLLTGHDARACEAMNANPGVAPTLPARIFCLTRSGDWAAAALTLDTGRALGAITDDEDLLLAHFLDPEMFEGEAPPSPPRPLTPLAFRLLDGIGETPPTASLPIAFAAADLRSTAGWKAQIEAAERLARVRALDPNRLLALYTERRAAASGGVWDRADAVARLDAALGAGDSEAIAAALLPAAERMTEARLLVPFAALFGKRLAAEGLDGPAGDLALRLGLLSPDYETVAQGAAPASARDAFAVALAQGRSDAAPPPGDALAEAVADGMAGSAPERLARMASAGRLGEALLETAGLLAEGAEADPQDIAEALAFFRSVGLTDTARRTALQLLLT